MKGAEKLILIPVEKYERLLENQQTKDCNQYDELDTAVFDILQEKEMTKKDKVEAYRKVLQQHMDTDVNTDIDTEMIQDSDNNKVENDNVNSISSDIDDLDNASIKDGDMDIKPPGVSDLDQIGKGYFDGPPGIRDINNLGKIKKKKKNKIVKWEIYTIDCIHNIFYAY